MLRARIDSQDALSYFRDDSTERMNINLSVSSTYTSPMIMYEPAMDPARTIDKPRSPTIAAIRVWRCNKLPNRSLTMVNHTALHSSEGSVRSRLPFSFSNMPDLIAGNRKTIYNSRRWNYDVMTIWNGRMDCKPPFTEIEISISS